MKLLVVLASTRKGRSGKKVSDWFKAQVEKDGRFEADVVDLKDLALSYELSDISPASIQDSIYQDEKTTEWAKHVNAADAVVFVMPEYNHGYPASLKNAVDQLFHEWNGKPAGFVGYGSAGATYAIGAFGLVAAWVHLDIVNAHVGIPEVWAAFNEQGELANTSYHEYEAKTLIDSLVGKIEAKQ